MSRGLLVLALIGLAAGALVGLWGAYPVLVPELLNPEELGAALEDEQWREPTEAHLIRASRARIEITANARRVNDEKARRLRVGVVCAAVGIVLLLAAVIAEFSVHDEQPPPTATPTTATSTV